MKVTRIKLRNGRRAFIAMSVGRSGEVRRQNGEWVYVGPVPDPATVVTGDHAALMAIAVEARAGRSNAEIREAQRKK
jgi:hypothetical protein